MSENEVKYCEDCKWCVPAERTGEWPWSRKVKDYEFAKCHHPQLMRYEDKTEAGRARRVSRKFDVPPEPEPSYCENVRDRHSSCGPEAKYFEPREEAEAA